MRSLMWTPPVDCTAQETALLSYMTRTRKLFGFLRRHRHELFDAPFQQQLIGMYEHPDAGKEPLPPALLAMALLLQAYLRVSDAELVQLTLVDLRVQLVLGCLGGHSPAFSQGALVNFRERLIAHDLDRRLLERTVELARTTQGFDPKSLPTQLRIAVDSSPLAGAGRVEDSVNLVAHATRNLVTAVVKATGIEKQTLIEQLGLRILQHKSAKRALDIDWSQVHAKEQAVNRLVEQVEAAVGHLFLHHPEAVLSPQVEAALATLRQLFEQDLEPDEQGGLRIKKGVAPDRRISIEDPQMRHGRKSRSKRIDGYKRHIAVEMDSEWTGLILACALTAANRPEGEATPALQADLQQQGVSVQALYIDRGYLKSELAEQTVEKGAQLYCRPWPQRNGALYPKTAFQMDFVNHRLVCPTGQSVPMELGKTTNFDGSMCSQCPQRTLCTKSPQRGRSVTIAEDEPLQHKLRELEHSPQGRQQLRQRVVVEHRQAHLVRRQTTRARYRGIRKNLYDVRRCSAIENLHLVQALPVRLPMAS